MEIRSIQKTGGSSFTLTLPKKWVEGCGLSEKDQLECYFQRNKIMSIRPHGKEENHQIELRIDDLSLEQIGREIIGYYVAGINQITLLADSITSSQRILIRKMSHKMVGFEIFESTMDKIVLRNVSYNLVKVSEYIERMGHIVLAMYEDLVKAVEENNDDIARDVIERDVEVDRINLLIDRQYHALLYSLIPTGSEDVSLLDLHYYNLVGIRLERIADHVVRIAYSLTQLKSKDKLILDNDEQVQLRKVGKYISTVNQMIGSFDKVIAHELLNRAEKHEKNEFINRKITNSTSLNILVSDSLERIRSYCANIAEETINHSCMQLVLK